MDNMFKVKFTDLPCGHTMHEKCFDKMIKYHKRCPLCKKPFKLPKKVKNNDHNE